MNHMLHMAGLRGAAGRRWVDAVHSCPCCCSKVLARLGLNLYSSTQV